MVTFSYIFIFFVLIPNLYFLNQAVIHNVIATTSYGRIRVNFTKTHFSGFGYDFFVPPDMELESNCQKMGVQNNSPYFENFRSSSIFCLWKITAPLHYQVGVKFQSLEIGSGNNCSESYLKIKNGHSTLSPVLGRYCGVVTPGEVLSSTQKITIELFSSSLTDKEGFSLSFFKVGCGEVINSTKGMIASPFFPDFYPTNKHCIWDIIIPPRHYAVLKFTDFDIGKFNNNCEFDNVILRSEAGKNEFQVLGKLCGSKIPESFIFKKNFQIEFNSGNLSTNKSGFSATFSTDVDECAIQNGGCEHLCDIVNGSYFCSCKSGFILSENLQNCTDEDECFENNGGCQHKCNNMVGSYHCSCPAGYLIHDDQHNCIDENECSINNGGCQHLCSNAIGSYVCSCFSGFMLDENRHNCKDVDECLADNGRCGHTCNNSFGSHFCSCGNGFYLHENKRDCMDEDECAMNIDGCLQICNNNIGSYSCSCWDGYVIHDNQRNCTDIDECLSSNGNCQHQCNNFNGSYSCSCENGYQLQENNHNCIDVDECTENKDGCHHICHNNIGSYSCSCENGFYLSENNHDCLDRNECNIENGGCQQICHNTPGSYFCSCFIAFLLKTDQHSCEANCSFVITSKDGFISSPGYPDLYPPGITCSWHFVIDPGYRILLLFQKFEVEYRSGCSYDVVKIYNGGSVHADILGTLCGKILPEEFTSSGNEMYVIFHSDKSQQRKGFLAQYITSKDKCFTSNGGCQHLCNSTFDKYSCSCQTGFFLHENKHDCIDHNECDTDNGGCQQICQNNPGSYNCLCREGFQLERDGYLCKDKNECLTNYGGCQHKCSNSVGSYACSCRRGFRLHKNEHDCQDVNECDENLDSCRHFCNNTYGSYICSCLSGFDLAEDGYTCIRNCSYVITDRSGNVSSPGYPHYYGFRVNCSWHWIAPVGFKIQLNFHQLQTNCSDDFLQVYDGGDSNAQLYGTYCGKNMPSTISPSGNELYMVFRSDNRKNVKGFSAGYDTVCGGVVLARDTASYLYSHLDYGNKTYGTYESCYWNIKSFKSNRRIVLKFVDFWIERAFFCNSDYLEIRNGDSYQRIGYYCGSQIPTVFVSSGYPFLLYFQTDGYIGAEYDGFKLEFYTVE